MSVWLHIALPAFLETLFLSVALCCVYRAQKNRIYPAFWQLLIFWAVSQGIQFIDAVTQRLSSHQRCPRLLRLLLRILGILRNRRGFDPSRAARDVPSCRSLRSRRAEAGRADLLLGNHHFSDPGLCLWNHSACQWNEHPVSFRPGTHALSERPGALHVDVPCLRFEHLGCFLPQPHLRCDIRIRDDGSRQIWFIRLFLPPTRAWPAWRTSAMKLCIWCDCGLGRLTSCSRNQLVAWSRCL